MELGRAPPCAPPPFARVAPALFIGSARAAGASELLARTGVTLCVNVSRQQPGPRAPGMVALRVPVFDDPAEDLLAHLEPTCATMEAAVRAGGACLVYCKNGRSRSAAVCTAYLMRHRGLSLAQAFEQDTPPLDPHRGCVSEALQDLASSPLQAHPLPCSTWLTHSSHSCQAGINIESNAEGE
ncbi:dual specificity phosphatase 28 isoform 2-T2 [Trichechus inunguis]